MADFWEDNSISQNSIEESVRGHLDRYRIIYKANVSEVFLEFIKECLIEDILDKEEDIDNEQETKISILPYIPPPSILKSGYLLKRGGKKESLMHFYERYFLDLL